MRQIAIHWFRQDLRLADNSALLSAIRCGNLLPIYILDDECAGDYQYGAASRVWLHHSLVSLNQSLDGNLRVYKGNTQRILARLLSRFDIACVYWNSLYEPWRMNSDFEVSKLANAADVTSGSVHGSLLWEPTQTLKSNGAPYKVFTAFYKNACLNAPEPLLPLSAPQAIGFAKGDFDALDGIDDLGLLSHKTWEKRVLKGWRIGEEGAIQRLQAFATHGINNYKNGRNLPAKPFVSRLSPHIHWGEISPRTIWHAINLMGDDENIQSFKSELGWREFCHSLLYNFPAMPQQNMSSKFDHFPWIDDKDALNTWQRGVTGFPIVDAGMRELWHTGYMHNRVRMIVGSFLVKNLRIHWRCGQAWFWDTLFDADLANNSAGWQWVAGSGVDAAPYFRIFNPISQGEKFDPDGDYTRKWVPELKHLPIKYLYQPGKAPPQVLQAANVKLGDNYPEPIIDLKTSREAALAAFKSIAG